eukprot:g8819.t1
MLSSRVRNLSTRVQSCQTPLRSAKMEFESQEAKEQYIKKRIEESRQRRANRKFDFCPACKSGVGSRLKFLTHLQHCCPDLLPDTPVNISDEHKFTQLVASINAKEKELRKQALFYRYNDPSRSTRRTIEEVAEVMKLPLDRTDRLIKLASREIPLVKDNDSIQVLYEDDQIIAVMKLPFMITAPKHRFEGGTLFNRVFGYLDREPYGLHRLDMNTSGVVLFAKDSKSAAQVNEQFKEKTVEKEYLAIGVGVSSETEFEVETLIDIDPDHDTARRVSTTDGKWSVTSFTVLDSNAKIDLMNERTSNGWNSTRHLQKGASLLLCKPKTGRTHQIRLHAMHKGHSLIGDDLYGILGPWIDRQALHAFSIRFTQPMTGERIKVVAPPPTDFANALQKLGLSVPTTLLSSSVFS